MGHKFFITAAIALLGAIGMQAEVVDFTYAQPGGKLGAWGNKLRENYNVAIRLDGSEFSGMKVLSLSVPVPASTEEQATDLGEVTAWLTKELAVESKKNVADICTEAATIDIANGTLSVTFSEPYTITADGVYVGYTLPLSKLTDYTGTPVAIASGDNVDGLYVYCSRSDVRWSSKVEKLKGVSAMSVQLETASDGNSATITAGDKVYGKADTSVNVPVTVTNYGAQAINSIDYTVTVGSEAPVNGNLNVAVAGIFGAETKSAISVKVPAECGDYELTIAVNAINGTAITPAETKCTLVSSPFMTVNRPLVEEYTGFWCGNCPVGLGSLAYMHSRYGDKLTTLAWHNNDPLAITSNYPQTITDYPDVRINRGVSIYPTNMEDPWKSAADAVVPMDVDVTIEWIDEACTELKATAAVKFMDSRSDANTYKVGIALVEDGMSNTEWVQANYISGQAASYPGTWFAPYTSAGREMRGVVYDDVVLAFPNPYGAPGSIPAEVTQAVAVECSETFNLDDIRNIQGANPIISKAKIRAVAVVFDTNDYPVNTNTSTYAPAESAIAAIEAAGEGSVSYTDLQGRLVAAPRPGNIYVRTVNSQSTLIRL